ncbi:MAG: hypothetical protein AB8G22_11970 [Saprospiraceae bacterium]
MKTYLLLFLSFLLSTCSFCQVSDTLNQDAEPIGGINELALHYYSIDFTKEQRKLLKDTPLEFIFLIDEFGTATLREVNGTNNAIILDSLLQRSEELPPFQPSIQSGVTVPGIYFMQLTFPTYRMSEQQLRSPYLWGSPVARLDEFEYIEFSKSRFDLIVGIPTSQIFGNINEYVNLGFGLETKFAYANENGWGGGLNLSMSFHPIEIDFPINSNREQLEQLPVLFLGGYATKWIHPKGNSQQPFSLQFELNYVQQNVTTRIDGLDPPFVNFKGFAPGVAFHYPLPLFRGKRTYAYQALSTTNGFLNIHAAVRQLFMSNKAANGTMLEVGLGFRMTNRKVVDYKLKE